MEKTLSDKNEPKNDPYITEWCTSGMEFFLAPSFQSDSLFTLSLGATHFPPLLACASLRACMYAGLTFFACVVLRIRLTTAVTTDIIIFFFQESDE